MKRAGSLFEQTFTPESLYAAYLDARRHKRAKRACFQFERALGANLETLHSSIHAGTYRPLPHYQFTIYAPKERVISAPAFRDCVVQHAVYRVVQPVFDRSFIWASFACRTGLGTHRASDYVLRALRAYPDDMYVLELDVRRFFYSIDRGILRRLVGRQIKDARLVELMLDFADHGEPLGIPIGSLLSQLFALIYLNPLDHFIKRDLHVKHYARYVDDLILIGLPRATCLSHRAVIEDFLRTQLHLELSRSSVHRIKHGVNYVGYRTWQRGRLIRKHALFRFRRAVRAGNLAVVTSLLGHARRTRSLQHMLTTTKELNHGLYRQIPPSHRRLHHPCLARTAARGGRARHRDARRPGGVHLRGGARWSEPAGAADTDRAGDGVARRRARATPPCRLPGGRPDQPPGGGDDQGALQPRGRAEDAAGGTVAGERPVQRLRGGVPGVGAG